MKVFNNLSLAVLFFSSVACSTTPEIINRSREINIFYTPFHHETLYPITPENIEENATCEFRIPADTKEVDQIIKIFKEVIPGEFNDHMVRLKISNLEKEIIFVDKYAGILTTNVSEPIRLKGYALEQLEELIKQFANDQTCKIKIEE